MSPRVVVADATPFLRLAVRSALADDGIMVVAEAATGEDAVQSARELGPDVVLLDGGLDPDGALVRRLCATSPAICVVVLSPDVSDAAALGAVRAGACGFLPKDTDPERLPAIVRGVAEGEAAIPRHLMRRLLTELRTGAAGAAWPSASLGLSLREREVLDLLCGGLSDRAVAERLDISEITVRRHVAAARRKLGGRHRVDALRRYRDTPGGAALRPAASPAA